MYFPKRMCNLDSWELKGWEAYWIKPVYVPVLELWPLLYWFILMLPINELKLIIANKQHVAYTILKMSAFKIQDLMDYSTPLCLTGFELQLRMAGDSRVLMDHNMEIGVTPAQVNCTATAALTMYWKLYSVSAAERERHERERMWENDGVVMEAHWESRGRKRDGEDMERWERLVGGALRVWERKPDGLSRTVGTRWIKRLLDIQQICLLTDYRSRPAKCNHTCFSSSDKYAVHFIWQGRQGDEEKTPRSLPVAGGGAALVICPDSPADWNLYRLPKRVQKGSMGENTHHLLLPRKRTNEFVYRPSPPQTVLTTKAKDWAALLWQLHLSLN